MEYCFDSFLDLYVPLDDVPCELTQSTSVFDIDTAFDPSSPQTSESSFSSGEELPSPLPTLGVATEQDLEHNRGTKRARIDSDIDNSRTSNDEAKIERRRMQNRIAQAKRRAKQNQVQEQFSAVQRANAALQHENIALKEELRRAKEQTLPSKEAVISWGRAAQMKLALSLINFLLVLQLAVVHEAVLLLFKGLKRKQAQQSTPQSATSSQSSASSSQAQQAQQAQQSSNTQPQTQSAPHGSSDQTFLSIQSAQQRSAHTQSTAGNQRATQQAATQFTFQSVTQAAQSTAAYVTQAAQSTARAFLQTTTQTTPTIQPTPTTQTTPASNLQQSFGSSSTPQTAQSGQEATASMLPFPSGSVPQATQSGHQEATTSSIFRFPSFGSQTVAQPQPVAQNNTQQQSADNQTGDSYEQFSQHQQSSEAFRISQNQQNQQSSSSQAFQVPHQDFQLVQDVQHSPNVQSQTFHVTQNQQPQQFQTSQQSSEAFQDLEQDRELFWNAQHGNQVQTAQAQATLNQTLHQPGNQVQTAQAQGTLNQTQGVQGVQGVQAQAVSRDHTDAGFALHSQTQTTLHSQAETSRITQSLEPGRFQTSRTDEVLPVQNLQPQHMEQVRVQPAQDLEQAHAAVRDLGATWPAHGQTVQQHVQGMERVNQLQSNTFSTDFALQFQDQADQVQTSQTDHFVPAQTDQTDQRDQVFQQEDQVSQDEQAHVQLLQPQDQTTLSTHSTHSTQHTQFQLQRSGDLRPSQDLEQDHVQQSLLAFQNLEQASVPVEDLEQAHVHSQDLEQAPLQPTQEDFEQRQMQLVQPLRQSNEMQTVSDSVSDESESSEISVQRRPSLQQHSGIDPVVSFGGWRESRLSPVSLLAQLCVVLLQVVCCVQQQKLSPVRVRSSSPKKFVASNSVPQTDSTTTCDTGIALKLDHHSESPPRSAHAQSSQNQIHKDQVHTSSDDQIHDGEEAVFLCSQVTKSAGDFCNQQSAGDLFFDQQSQCAKHSINPLEQNFSDRAHAQQLFATLMLQTQIFAFQSTEDFRLQAPPENCHRRSVAGPAAFTSSLVVCC
eukprot:CAMPEP_0175100756 /NCGR_PEP_ID=MMETSP0086_2-20121207/7325_1 /TAXON_ID=136419 /ORGANISM="Unknown Unknown, Strain D1" /LENGTH=1053 /DNA_ID=CAMNT_0016375025 /DNA_START=33 /DNA_END=3194 /DNA_ORIENTATION=+